MARAKKNIGKRTEIKFSVPLIKFSSWVPIEDWKSLRPNHGQRMGIYLISKKKIGLKSKSPAKRSDKEIVYIGMSTSSTLSRVRAFYRDVQKKYSRHSGASIIVENYGAYPKSKTWKKFKLFVAVYTPYEKASSPLIRADYWRMGRIAFLEYWIMGRWFSRMGYRAGAEGFLPEANRDRAGKSR